MDDEFKADGRTSSSGGLPSSTGAGPSAPAWAHLGSFEQTRKENIQQASTWVGESLHTLPDRTAIFAFGMEVCGSIWHLWCVLLCQRHDQAQAHAQNTFAEAPALQVGYHVERHILCAGAKLKQKLSLVVPAPWALPARGRGAGRIGS